MPKSSLKKAITGMAATVTTCAVVFLLTACSSGSVDPAQAAATCAEMKHFPVDNGAQSIVIGLDASASMRNGTWINSTLDSLVTQAAGVYSTLSVAWVGGMGEPPVWAVDNLPLNNDKYDFDTKHYNEQVQRASSCVVSMIGSPSISAPGTDLGTMIQVGADRLAQATGPKKLIIVSDGLSNTGPISLTGAIATTAVNAALAKLDTEGYKPDLASVDVTFAGLGVTAGAVTDGPTVNWLKRYYAGVCERGGAARCATPVADQGATSAGTKPRANAPKDPDLELPVVQFEFSDAEVRFEPDSAVLTAGADASLGKAAACLTQGSGLTVIGHSAYVGDPAGEQAMSEQRAQNVANRILDLAGRPAIKVNAFGVGSSEPKSASGKAAEDRRVDVSLTGVCG